MINMLDIPYLVERLYLDIPIYSRARHLGSLNNNFAPSLYITTNNSQVPILLGATNDPKATFLSYDDLMLENRKSGGSVVSNMFNTGYLLKFFKHTNDTGEYIIGPGIICRNKVPLILFTYFYDREINTAHPICYINPNIFIHPGKIERYIIKHIIPEVPSVQLENTFLHNLSGNFYDKITISKFTLIIGDSINNFVRESTIPDPGKMEDYSINSFLKENIDSFDI